MKLALYSSLPKGTAPNLLALQDEALGALPTVLVCPLKTGLGMTALRLEIRWGDLVLIACPELARPIRRTALRPLGWLDAELSRQVMERFLMLLAQ